MNVYQVRMRYAGSVLVEVNAENEAKGSQNNKLPILV